MSLQISDVTRENQNEKCAESVVKAATLSRLNPRGVLCFLHGFSNKSLQRIDGYTCFFRVTFESDEPVLSMRRKVPKVQSPDEDATVAVSRSMSCRKLDVVYLAGVSKGSPFSIRCRVSLSPLSAARLIGGLNSLASGINISAWRVADRPISDNVEMPSSEISPLVSPICETDARVGEGTEAKREIRIAWPGLVFE